MTTSAMLRILSDHTIDLDAYEAEAPHSPVSAAGWHLAEEPDSAKLFKEPKAVSETPV